VVAEENIPTVSDTVGTVFEPVLVRPRLRGTLHAYAAGVSVLTGVALVTVAAVERSARAGWSTALYSLTIVFLFGVSGLYHRGKWSERGRRVMKRLDHSMIFVFIAGTYTPIAVLALSHHAAVSVLAVVWSGAAAGVVLKMFWPTAPRWLGVPLYIALGWVAAFVMPGIVHGAGVTALVLIIVGGLAYTAGGIVYGLKRPNPFPTTFGFHEVFHVCTLLAAGCHYVAIWLVVMGSPNT